MARSLPVQRDRISSDGSWSSALSPLDKGSEGKQPYVIGSPVTPGETAPNLPPVPAATVDRLAELIQGARGTLVLTGAGCSTESGVPDYRGALGGWAGRAVLRARCVVPPPARLSARRCCIAQPEHVTSPPPPPPNPRPLFRGPPPRTPHHTPVRIHCCRTSGRIHPGHRLPSHDAPAGGQRSWSIAVLAASRHL